MPITPTSSKLTVPTIRDCGCLLLVPSNFIMLRVAIGELLPMSGNFQLRSDTPCMTGMLPERGYSVRAYNPSSYYRHYKLLPMAVCYLD